MRQAVPAVLAVVVLCLSVETSTHDYRYHRYDAMAKFLQNFTQTYANMTRLYSIGKSVQGRDLQVVEITAVKKPEIGVPNVKLIGNIHGNEAVGREILLYFLEYLAESYATDATIQWYLNNTRLHILPSLNPDGFELSSEGLCDRGNGRENAKNADLNRSFPDFFRNNSKASQPETEAVQKWMKEVPFVLSASLHGGALVANYPYENVKEDVSLPPVIPPSVSPDDDVFQHLASLYATRHPKMHLGEPCPGTTKRFDGGITNGAAWYMLTGGMQDYNYVYHGCMEITLEISCCKYPPARELPKLWEENKMALLEYIKEAHRGVKGQIIDGITKLPISNASLEVVGRPMTFHSTNRGEFWRILLPGQYNLKVSAMNYDSQIKTFMVVNHDSISKMTELNVELYPVGHQAVTSESSIQSTDGSTSSNPVRESGKVPRELNFTDKDDYIFDETPKEIASAVMSKASDVTISFNSILLAIFVWLLF